MASKKVLYIGDDSTYHLFDDVARRTESEIVPYYAVSQSAENIIDKAYSDTYAMIILNVAEIISAKDKIMNIINAIQSAVKTNFVIMAEGYLPESSLIIESARIGVSFFILTSNGSERNRIFMETLAGVKNVYEVVGDNLQKRTVNIESQRKTAKKARQKYNSVSVAVAGCIQRMGCTSVVIQLIKFFNSQGKTACFIDLSDTDYVEECAQYYGTESEDFEHHRIAIDGVDMYYRVTAEIMSFIELQGYDFMVFDMGNISDKPQKQTEFLQKKYRLLVTGSKPNEAKSFYNLLDNIYKTKISYLYNFVPSADRETVESDVKTMNAKCYFIPFMDEVFSLVSESVPLFHEIFENELPPLPEETTPIKRKGLFGKFKKKGQEG